MITTVAPVDQTRPATAPIRTVQRYSPTLALFPARLFIAFGWLRAGIEKTIDTQWWTGEAIRSFLVANDASMLPFATPAVGLLSTGAPVIAAIVLVFELALGMCILTGRRLRTALISACGLNVAFIVFGAVNPSAFYLVVQIALIFGLTQPSGSPSRWRRWSATAASAGLAVAMIPFIATLHPAEVIEDPAVILATLASLVGLTQLIAEIERR